MKDNYFGELFNEIASEVELYTKENEKDDFVKTLTGVNIDEIIDVLDNLLPRIRRNSYTLDRDIINIIDFISSRLLPKKTKVTRSDIVNELLLFSRMIYNNEIDEYKTNSLIHNSLSINKEYSKKFFEIIRGEAEESIIDKFGFEKEFGKQGLRLDLTLENIVFLEEIQKLQKDTKISQTLNDILKALFRKRTRE